MTSPPTLARSLGLADAAFIGLGSMITNLLLKGEVSPRYVPLASIAEVAVTDR